MKFRIHHLAILSLSALLIAAGCGNNAVNSSTTTNASGAAEATALPESSKLNIKVSFYPIYEFTKNVAGDLADVEALIPAGIEPHDWEPTAKDMAEISDADMLIYNGAGMEGWVDQVLESVSGTPLITVEASKGLDIMEGTEEEEEEADHHHEEGEHVHEEGEHAHEEGEHAHEEHSHDHGGLDPHVWLNPTLAIQEVRNIEAALAAAAPEHAEDFKTNADAYVAKLEQLDQEFKDGLKDTKRKDFITQHAAFGYLAKQYGLTQVPIAGLSPEQEPSAANMSKIVEFAKEHKVKTIFFETLVSSSVADTIAKEIGAKAAVLNPIEGLTEEDRSQNLDYLGIMRQNLEALKSALNE
ncbi:MULTISPECIES: metal ABC transporter substrate-binding protein [Paenibacillus]|jgi:zinc transport system substrate-binding protein|uniref:Zinc ABC transporter substrate-binding protein n=1 Tax=Paenibacillus odorifer TaxID=189426 RepID=A0ABX3GLB3_9BACL|nr:metal ABC transporter substrate-binding protein [Paenibacillus odorifer]OMD30171.1 zinc ABC transporter substrate-binding protein [Paenibacillus odorifer]